MIDVNAAGSRLAVIRPSDTDAALAFTAALNTEITAIVVCNVTGASPIPLMRVFHAIDGDGYDEDTALFWDFPVQYTERVLGLEPNSGISLMPGDTIGVRSSISSGLVFHIYGVTQSIAPQ